VRPEPPDHRPAAGERGRLTAHGVRPRRRLGQNFLVDPGVSRETVRRAAWPAGAPVLEIGAGGGALTAELVTAGHPVTAVEIDAALVALLHERFAMEIADARLRAVEGDILAVPLEPLLDVLAGLPAPPIPSGTSGAVIAPPGRPWVAGNLPYGSTTPILLRVLACAGKLDGAVFMVQREYGERLLAGAGEDAYSSISVRTAAQARVRRLLLVGRSSFWPRPGVESLVVELVFPRPAPYPGPIRALERVLRAGFGQRRKTLENALAHGLGWTKEETRSVLQRAGCDPGARAETLPLDRFAALAALVDER
jgi:16S rRNA (adenine1518-N6/adenine1519-N6)-dimethyltransferase